MISNDSVLESYLPSPKMYSYVAQIPCLQCAGGEVESRHLKSPAVIRTCKTCCVMRIATVILLQEELASQIENSACELQNLFKQETCRFEQEGKRKLKNNISRKTA